MSLFFPAKSPTPEYGRWVSVDFHIHSTYSKGSLSPEEIVRLAGTYLFDAIAIADHHEVKGGLEAQTFSGTNAKYPQVLVAQEVSAGDHFHILLIGGKPARLSSNRQQIVSQVTDHHQAGGVTILAHPWTMPKANWAWDCLQELVANNLLDGIELFNASILDCPEWGTITRQFVDNWIVPYNLGIFGGSDFHYWRGNRLIGTGRTYLKTFTPGEAGILDAIRSRRSVAGLFNHHFIDLGWLGSGNSIIYGNGIWFKEFKAMVSEIEEHLLHCRYFDSNYTQLLNRLFEAGHYQYVKDLISRKSL